MWPRVMIFLVTALFGTSLGLLAAASLGGPWQIPLPPHSNLAAGPAWAAGMPALVNRDDRQSAAGTAPPVRPPGTVPGEVESWAAVKAFFLQGTPADQAKAASEWINRLTWSGSPKYEEGIAYFFYFGKAQTVSVSGDLNGWRETYFERLGDTDLWVAEMALPGAAILSYRIMVDGRSVADPLNPRQTWALGNRFSVFIGPDAPRDPRTARPDNQPGPVYERVAALGIKSYHLQRKVSVDVWLPAGCTPVKPCGAVYVLDGPFYMEEGRLADTLTALAATGQLPPLAVLAIDPGQDPMRRLAEMLPSSPGSAAMVMFLTAELIPRIEKEFPILPARQNRILLGTSAGGAVAIQIALQQPEAFARIIAQSPAVLPFLHRRAQAEFSGGKADRKPREWPSIYISWGQFEENVFGLNITAEARQLAGELKTAGLAVDSELLVAGHNMVAWGRTLGSALTRVWSRGACGADPSLVQCG